MHTHSQTAAAGRDRSEELSEHVRAAFAAGTPLAPLGGGSKAFYGQPPRGEPLPLLGHTGVVSYEPSELVLTARAGTALADLETLLAAQGQMIASEPPHFAGGATLGGAVAAGLSGPRRPWAGALRDHVLGVRILDGRGRPARFGGEVMKNVAGFDIARLMAGSLGTLGVILEVSLKVLPKAEVERTLVREEPVERLQSLLRHAAERGIQVTGAAHEAGLSRLRVAGAASTVAAALASLGGEPGEPGDDGYWARLRDHRLDFFRRAPGERLWRWTLPAATPPGDAPGRRLIDWGGQLHWVCSAMDPLRMRQAAAALGAQATLFEARAEETAFPPPDAALGELHRRLKKAFDPAGILNPGRLQPDT